MNALTPHLSTELTKMSEQGMEAALEIAGFFNDMHYKITAGLLDRPRTVQVLDQVRSSLGVMLLGINTARRYIRPAIRIPRGRVLYAVDRMAEELSYYLFEEVAEERARNIAQALQDGEADPVQAIAEILEGHLEGLEFADQVLAVTHTCEAWNRVMGGES